MQLLQLLLLAIIFVSFFMALIGWVLSMTNGLISLVLLSNLKRMPMILTMKKNDKQASA
ncbi:hypothetical protein [Enterococcus casseliflavus]|uniref:hypothetical protein n=1 Tax=Enterococcus casseliflavus TaxID=37734 RepID=UPI001D16DEFD|nr:hypothetical protein [Enterococcus casseliflavus]